MAELDRAVSERSVAGTVGEVLIVIITFAILIYIATPALVIGPIAGDKEYQSGLCQELNFSPVQL